MLVVLGKSLMEKGHKNGYYLHKYKGGSNAFTGT